MKKEDISRLFNVLAIIVFGIAMYLCFVPKEFPTTEVWTCNIIGWTFLGISYIVRN